MKWPMSSSGQPCHDDTQKKMLTIINPFGTMDTFKTQQIATIY